MKIHYNSKLKNLSRKLRNNGVLSEALLWHALRGKKMRGYFFTRQKPINRFIVDFYCHRLRLVIEIDGYSHKDKFEKDKTRQNKLESPGLTVLRFSDTDIKKDINNALEVIDSWIIGFEKLRGEQPPDPLC